MEGQRSPSLMRRLNLASNPTTTTTGTPGGMGRRDYFFEEPLPFDEEQVTAFVNEFERYAEIRQLTNNLKRRHLKQLLPKKLNVELNEIFPMDEPWSSIREFLLKCGEIEKQNRRKNQLEKLRSWAKKKVSKYSLSRFLLYFENFADRCDEVPDAQKCKIVLRVVPRHVKKTVKESLHKGDYNFEVILSRLKDYAEKQVDDDDFFGDSSEMDSERSSETENSEESEDENREKRNGRRHWKQGVNQTAVAEKKSSVSQEPVQNQYLEEMMVKMFQRMENLFLEKRPSTSRNTSRRCLYCDSFEHLRDHCQEFQEALRKGFLKIGENGRVCFMNGVPIPPRFGQGGMKTYFQENQEVVSSSCILTVPTVPGHVEVIQEDEPQSMVALRKRRKTNGEPLDQMEETRLEDDLSHKPVVETVPALDLPPVEPQPAEPQGLVKKRRGKYKLAADIHKLDRDDVVLRHLNSGNLGISPYEYIAVVPRAQDLLRRSIRRKRVYHQNSSNAVVLEDSDSSTEISDDDNEFVEVKNMFQPVSFPAESTVRLPVVQTPVTIAGVYGTAIIDPGSEVNIICRTFAKLIPAEKITPYPEIAQVFGIGNFHMDAGRILLNSPVTTGKVTVTTSFLCTEEDSMRVILGMPWLNSGDWTVSRSPQGQKFYKIRDDNNVECFPIMETFSITTEKVQSTSVFTTSYGVYKPVGKKIHPVPVPLPDEFQTTEIPKPELSGSKIRLTSESIPHLIIGDGEMSERERKYFLGRLKEVDSVFAFNSSHLGLLHSSVEEPIRIPTVKHEPWFFKALPIPRPLFNKVVEMLRDWLDAGIIEPSNGPYASRWFSILKKDGKSLRFIQDLQLANKVTIRNAAVPPVADDITEDLSGCLMFSTFDLYSGYDQIPVDIRDRDIFAINTPIGLMRMTSLPMGWTNSVAVFQRIMYKVLQAHLPHRVSIFIDDGIIKTRMDPRKAQEQVDGIG